MPYPISRDVRSSLTPPSNDEDSQAFKTPATIREAKKRYYYSEKGQQQNALLKERRRIDNHLRKSIRDAQKDLDNAQILGYSSDEIDKRRQTLETATQAQKEEQARRPRPGRKSNRPKGTADEERARRRAIQRELYLKRKAQAATEREEQANQ